jgi:hypothetical protein
MTPPLSGWRLSLWVGTMGPEDKVDARLLELCLLRALLRGNRLRGGKICRGRRIFPPLRQQPDLEDALLTRTPWIAHLGHAHALRRRQKWKQLADPLMRVHADQRIAGGVEMKIELERFRETFQHRRQMRIPCSNINLGRTAGRVDSDFFSGGKGSQNQRTNDGRRKKHAATPARELEGINHHGERDAGQQAKSRLSA